MTVGHDKPTWAQDRKTDSPAADSRQMGQIDSAGQNARPEGLQTVQQVPVSRNGVAAARLLPHGS